MPGTDRQIVVVEASPADAGAPTLAEIISALSFALDLTEGAVPGHALRCCLIGMRLGWELGFSDRMLGDLYHALLLKDVGCSSNAARMCQIIGGGDDRVVKSGAKLEDWTKPHKPSLPALRLLWGNVLPEGGPLRKAGRILRIALTQHRNNEEMIQLRCDRGASIVRKIGLSEQTAQAVRSLDEHWDGSGYPERLAQAAISPLARVMAVAQHLDVFALERSPEQAMLVLRERSGRWFDPQMVRAAESLDRRHGLWMQCLPGGRETAAQGELTARSAVLDLAPAQTARIRASHIDLICEAFAEVVDAKSHFTFRHSVGVTDVASAIGTAMGLKPERKQLLHRAALLHDLGKLRVPNSILDKPGKLDGPEWSVMREHPALTRAILDRVKQFGELAYIAGAHHEKLDGSGYPDGLRAEELSLEARILAVADVYGALVEDRPYRRGFEPEQALAMLGRDVPVKLDADCLQALATIAPSLPRAESEPQACPLPVCSSEAPIALEPART
jgi:HD-GYP domain-containing protein (c-di-GMP phosphodiesterase class II)